MMKRYKVTFEFIQPAESPQDAADELIDGIQSGEWNGHLNATVTEIETDKTEIVEVEL